MMPGRRSVILLAVIFISVVALPACASQPSAGPAAGSPERAPGVFERVMEFFSGFSPTETSDEDTVESGQEGVFSGNPYVYIAAFWTEIVKAPKERPFLERIMAFLEAVRVNRKPGRLT